MMRVELSCLEWEQSPKRGGDGGGLEEDDEEGGVDDKCLEFV